VTEPNNLPPSDLPPITPPYASNPADALPTAMSKDDKSMAMLAHLLGLFTGFLGPLIIWLVKKDQSPFVDDQGKEALNFQIFALICIFGCALTFCVPPLFFILMIGIQITRIVFSIIGTVKANDGVAYRYPVNLRLIT
jgi:uncharacterized Tic20 family protein